MGEIITQIKKEKETIPEYNFSEIPGMTCGKMMRLTEAITSYTNQSMSVNGHNSAFIHNIMSFFNDRESQRSSI